VWQRGSADVNFDQTSGALNGFSFEFSGNPHSGQDARGTFSFAGSQDAAKAALGEAGLVEQSGPPSRPGADFRSPLDNRDNASHFNFDQSKSGSGGNFHTGETNMGAPGHAKQAFINALESLPFIPNHGGDK
jgi:hypothetical protein